MSTTNGDMPLKKFRGNVSSVMFDQVKGDVDVFTSDIFSQARRVTDV